MFLEVEIAKIRWYEVIDYNYIEKKYGVWEKKKVPRSSSEERSYAEKEVPQRSSEVRSYAEKKGYREKSGWAGRTQNK